LNSLRFSTPPIEEEEKKGNSEEEEKKILDEYHEMAMEATKKIDKNSQVISLNLNTHSP